MALTQRQQELVEAALRLLDREGIHGFTMRSLAGEIGLSPMAAYKHFENQRELQLELWRACILSFQEHVARVLEGCDGVDQLERLLIGAEAFIEYSLEHPNRFELVHHHPFVREVWQDRDIDNLRDAGWQQFFVLARAGQAEGSIRSDIDPEQLIAMSYACIHGTCYLLSSGRLQKQTGFGPDHYKELTIRLLRESLAPR